MRNKSVFLQIFLITFVLIGMLVSSLSCYANDNFIITSIVPDDTGKILLINGKNTGDVAGYKISKLENPGRIVLDIPNAILVGSKRSINLADTGVTNVRVAQFSADPNIVRVVFTADNKDNMRKLTFHKSENTIIFKLNGVEIPADKDFSVYHDKEIKDKTQEFIKINNEENQDIKEKQEDPTKAAVNITQKTEEDLKKLDKLLTQQKTYNNQNMVINTIKNINNHIILSGIGSISMKEPFILQNPMRLVVDIPNSSVISPELLRVYPLNGTDVIRVGQFDRETLRIVIETLDPNNYKTIISADLQSLVITPQEEINISNLTDSKSISQVQDIIIKKKDNKTTTITINSGAPMIHNTRHLYHPDRVILELYNVNAPPKALVNSLQRTSQFHNVNIGFIEKYPMGSSWVFPVNLGTKLESKLSIDGKTLELTFIDRLLAPKGRVVIDAGHGGSEPGARRSGIYEKHVTLDITKKVHKYLSMAGIDVIMTRSGDETLSLKERTEITNRINPDAFVSIHVNACENPNVSGIETHWYTSQSRELARHIQSRMVNYVRTPDRGTIKSMFYVIHHTKVPAVLVEIGFMSNENERCQIMTEERQEMSARAIADGVIQYLKLGH